MIEKIPGIIGGQGPYATHLFLGSLLRYAENGLETDHVHYFLDNNPKLPSRIDAICGRGESPVPGFQVMARNLETCGADFIVMPSNTSHVFYPQLAASVTIPFVNMIEVVSDSLVEAGGRHVVAGLLATTGCVRANLYQEALQRRGCRSVVPGETGLQRLMEVIHGLKSGQDPAHVARVAKQAAAALVDQGATVLVSACTELPMVLQAKDVPVDLVDSLDVLAKYTVDIVKGRRTISK